MLSYETTSLPVQASAPRKASTDISTIITRMVRDLNNKACVHVAMGDFAKANRLLGLALEKQKAISEGAYEEFDSMEFDEYDTEFEDEDDMDSSNDSFDYFHDAPQEQQDQNQEQEQSQYRRAPVSPVTGAPLGSVLCLPRTTKCKHVRNIPHAGQQEFNLRYRNEDDSQYSYHQVYSLPIVMDDNEWESASPDNQSFVLVFNSALSNHLWGMELLSLMGTSDKEYHHYRSKFQTAKALYHLTLETLENPGCTANGGTIRSVDKLCVPAIFNNLSHASKVLDGYGSRESTAYDQVLLKSLFWWIDGNSSVYTTVNSRELRRSKKEGDADVIDAFMDTVFYLVGAPEEIAPAAAA